MINATRDASAASVADDVRWRLPGGGVPGMGDAVGVGARRGASSRMGAPLYVQSGAWGTGRVSLARGRGMNGNGAKTALGARVAVLAWD